jgi:hypothetical protein
MVVHALEDDHPADAALPEDVAAESVDARRSDAARRDRVAADPFVQDGDLGVSALLQAPGEGIGPAVVAVGGRAAAVGDRVAQDRDRLRVSKGIDARRMYQWSVVCAEAMFAAVTLLLFGCR